MGGYCRLCRYTGGDRPRLKTCKGDVLGTHRCRTLASSFTRIHPLSFMTGRPKYDVVEGFDARDERFVDTIPFHKAKQILQAVSVTLFNDEVSLTSNFLPHHQCIVGLYCGRSSGFELMYCSGEDDSQTASVSARRTGRQVGLSKHHHLLWNFARNDLYKSYHVVTEVFGTRDLVTADRTYSE